MRRIIEFFDDEINWVVGCLCALAALLMYGHLPLLWQGLKPVTPAAWTSLIAMLIAFPAAWGIYRRTGWGRWMGLTVGSIMVFTLTEHAIHAPTVGRWAMTVGAIAFCWMVWQLDLREPWQQFTDSPGFRRMRAEVEKRVREEQLNPLPSCDVTLTGSKRQELDASTLQQAVRHAFDRACIISDETDNISLAVDIASSTTEQAVVGGYGNVWMIGVRPVCMQVYVIPAGSDSDHDTGHIYVSLSRRLDRETEIMNGYSWTVPLAAALWSPAIHKATIESDPAQGFITSEELLAAIPQLGERR